MRYMSRPLAAAIILSSVVGVFRNECKGAFDPTPFSKRSELNQLTRSERFGTYIVKYFLIALVTEHVKELQDVGLFRWGEFLLCPIKAHYNVLKRRVHGVHDGRPWPRKLCSPLTGTPKFSVHAAKNRNCFVTYMEIRKITCRRRCKYALVDWWPFPCKRLRVLQDNSAAIWILRATRCAE